MDRQEALRARDAFACELEMIKISLNTCRQHKDTLMVGLSSTDEEMAGLERAERECSARIRKLTSLIEGT
jgi:hypothetical protein